MATPPNPAAADTVQEDSSVTAAVGLQHGLEGHQGLGSPSEAETVLAVAPCLEAEQDGHGEEQSSKGSGVEKITYHVTDLTMQEYESLFAQWMGGTMTLGQIGEMYGEHVKELVQLQYVAMNGIGHAVKCSRQHRLVETGLLSVRTFEQTEKGA